MEERRDPGRHVAVRVPTLTAQQRRGDGIVRTREEQRREDAEVVVDAVVQRQQHVVVGAGEEVQDVPGMDASLGHRGDVEEGP
jgi:hypothetical protein